MFDSVHLSFFFLSSVCFIYFFSNCILSSLVAMAEGASASTGSSGLAGVEKGVDSGYGSVGRGRGSLTCSTPGKPDLSFSPVPKDISRFHLSEPETPVDSERVRGIHDNVSQSVNANPLDNAQHGSVSLAADHSSWGGTLIDATKLNIVLKSERKEPPFFRGDGTDKFTLCEWEGLMRGYLSKSGYTGRDLVDELLSRLMGRARDVVRIWLRNNVQVSVSGNVDAVFRILRQHFDSVVHSGMPLADFYATTPYVNEQSLDYWIRLNKAAEVAEQALGSVANSLGLQAVEVAAMFVRHCPDRDLSMMFLSKPQSEWTASEVQARLDEYLRCHKRQGGHVLQHAAVAVNESVSGNVPSDELVGVGVSDSAASESATVDKLLDMLEKVLACNVQAAQRHPEQSLKRNLRCDVCQGSDHSTLSHCKGHGLCFSCFSSEHTRAQCQSRARGARRAVGSGTAGHARRPGPAQGN